MIKLIFLASGLRGQDFRISPKSLEAAGWECVPTNAVLGVAPSVAPQQWLTSQQ
jgi:hypothetical protein